MADRSHNRIVVMNSAGDVVRVMTSKENNLGGSAGVALDASGNVLVAGRDEFQGYVIVFCPDNTTCRFETPMTAPKFILFDSSSGLVLVSGANGYGSDNSMIAAW